MGNTGIPTRIDNLGMIKLLVTFYIEMDGVVTITSLFAPLLPLAHALNPDDQRINKFLSTQTEVKNVTLFNNKDKAR